MTSASDIFFEVMRLEVDYWHCVDHLKGVGAEEFYTEDGLFVVGDERMTGRAEVAAFYEWRSRRGDRLARHSISNPRLAAWSEGRASFGSMMHLYADDGVPILESRPAIMIADVRSECIVSDARWRFTSHVLTPVFMGGARPTIPTRDQLTGAMLGSAPSG